MDFKQFYKTMQFDIDNEIRTVYQATQGDTKSRGLLVDLIVGGVKTPITTETMNFFALKPDGTRVMTAGVKDGDKFRIDFTNQTFAVPGTLLCALVLYGTSGEKIANKKFKMTVDTSLEDGAIISKDERGILDRAFDLASDIVPRLEGLDVPLLENLEQEVMEIKEDYARQVEFPITNLVANGDFSTPLVLGTYVGDIRARVAGSIKIIDGFKVVDGYYSDGTLFSKFRIKNTVVNHLYYISASVKGFTIFREVNETANTPIPPAIAERNSPAWGTLSAIVSGENIDKEIALYAGYASYDKGYFKDINAIDLTETFGIGNEPTKEEMDNMLDFLGGWFDGTLKPTVKQLTDLHLPMIQKNSNDIKAVDQRIDEIKSETFLRIPTPYDDGTGKIWSTHQTTHPSVIQFEGGWNGYKYWMVHTPYPLQNNKRENPCVCVSNDGIKWIEPIGIVNPLAERVADANNLSDGHLLYNELTLKMELWYREAFYTGTTFTGIEVKRLLSADGVTWTAPEIMFTNLTQNLVSGLKSHSIIFKDGKYKMWYTSGERNLFYTESADGKNWSVSTEVLTNNKRVNSWHTGLALHDGKYHLLMLDPDLMGLKYAYAEIGQETAFSEPVQVITSSANEWELDGETLYRAIPLWTTKGVMVIYGTVSQGNVWLLHIQSGKDFYNLKPITRKAFEFYGVV